MKKNKYEDCSCDEQSEPKLMTMEIPIARYGVVIRDIETRICLKCGEKYIDGKSLLDLEKEIRAKSNAEDLADIRAANRALKDGEFIAWEDAEAFLDRDD
jgi:hypothetical protein